MWRTTARARLTRCVVRGEVGVHGWTVAGLVSQRRLAIITPRPPSTPHGFPRSRPHASASLPGALRRAARRSTPPAAGSRWPPFTTETGRPSGLVRLEVRGRARERAAPLVRGRVGADEHEDVEARVEDHHLARVQLLPRDRARAFAPAVTATGAAVATLEAPRAVTAKSVGARARTASSSPALSASPARRPSSP